MTPIQHRISPPPSYDIIATIPPPPYAAIDMLVDDNIHVVDTVKPAPVYSDRYVPLEDIGMVGFTHTGLPTIFKEEVDEAVE
ncbi:hypothetical protein IW262DRAFT_1467405 [Armillaria fumosa]|nr:hypothetical protein IW262DRAFT_1467405 [Armillaria fumosa]